jgi:SAM-dependent methyltransferase
VEDRQKEIDKYRKVYQREDYRMGSARLHSMSLYLSKYSGSLLDVSCGRGELLGVARNLGFNPVYGTEAVPELCNTYVMLATIDELPVSSQSFDVVTCVDVIEHILEDDILSGLKELERVTKKTLLISAADYPDIWDGHDLHVSARPIDEWDAMFKQVFTGKVERLGPTSTSELWAVHYAS